jgi:hypothetical protein
LIILGFVKGHQKKKIFDDRTIILNEQRGGGGMQSFHNLNWKEKASAQ